MSLVATARRLAKALHPHAVLIGGVCGTLYGVERFTRDVDLASDLPAERTLALLQAAGIDGQIRQGEPGDTLSWVIHGICDGVEFQILPAADIGTDPSHAIYKVELPVAPVEEYITSKCIAGGQQDMHDVAALLMLNDALRLYAMQQAEKHGCLEKLESWLADERLKARYGP